jgi:hypothetical protein
MYYWKKGKRLHLIDPSTLDKYNIITTKQKPIKLSQFSKKDQEKIRKAPKQVKYVPLPVGAAAENKVVKTRAPKVPKAPAEYDPSVKAFTIPIDLKKGLKRGRKKALLKRDVSLEEIVNGFKQNSTFNNITSAIVRYNMDVNDALRPKNIGVGQDGRFVILDSSIKKSLEAGRETRA